jgi:hypothetical protein
VTLPINISATRAARASAAGIRAINGVVGLGEEVTWEATHLGVRQRLTCRMTAFNRPRMQDVFSYEPPVAWLGRCADVLFLRRYMERLLGNRAAVMMRVAETAAAAS